IAIHGRGIWIVDDITPLRALTPEVLGKSATFLQSSAAVQSIPAFGGWGTRDAAFAGDNPPGDAVITYYQRRRHVFGDLAIDVRDSSGKVLAGVAGRQQRRLHRVT